ncbi:MAG: DUF4976 domain-containing protein [Candidatus Altiarchaeales archaeon]|nr:DUF4976 domain-containing protein [Candidatus Altiarchaeales archaeon]
MAKRHEKKQGKLLLAVVVVVILAAGYLFLNRTPGYVCKDCNVIIIFVECLRYDHMGFNDYYRNTTPNLDVFAEKSFNFRKALTQAPWTKPSVASMFTSQYPHINKCLKSDSALPSSALTLTEVLKYHGYDTYGVIENPFLNYASKMQQGFNQYTSKAGDARMLTNEAISKLKEAKKPFFFYLHYVDPHHPYDPPKEFQKWADPNYQDVMHLTINVTTPNVWNIRTLYWDGNLTREDQKFIVDSYDGEILYADSQIGRLLKYMEDNGLLENTIVVISGDHGEEFFEHKSSEHGHTLYNELLHVALVIWNPKLEGGKAVEEEVHHLDLAPTILDMIGREIPRNFQGESIVPYMLGKKRTDATNYGEGVCYMQERKSIQKGGWKLIYNTEPEKYNTTQFELYDLEKDPEEQDNVYDNHKDETLVRNLKTELFVWIATNSSIEPERAKMTEETEERLKSLGYVI